MIEYNIVGLKERIGKMNQILISEKIYVTPGMKKKKKFFKFEFFLSVFLVCALSSYCIYAEYDRNKSEQVSREILADLNIEKQEEKLEQVVVVLNSAFEQELGTNRIIEEPQEIPSVQIVTAADGTNYYTIGKIVIPKINVDYPIFSETTTELLKIAPCKFWGADPNQVGNFCIVGHNYRNSLFFSKVPTLENGDVINITDLSGRTLEYGVYNKFEIEPDDTTCTTQLTNGRKEITIITCTNDGSKRVVVKAREI